MPTINGSANIFSFSPKICRYNNGTDVCDLGYKLKYPGRCISQSSGKANSTGFEPEYSICFTDYISRIGGRGSTYKVGTPITKDSNVVCSSNQITVESGPSYILPDSVDYTANCIQSSVEVSSDSVVYCRDLVKSSDALVISSEAGATGYANMHNYGKNIISHGKGISSEYWVVDTYGHNTVVSVDRFTIKSNNLVMSGKPTGSSCVLSVSGTTSLAYKAISSDVSLPFGRTLASGTEGENPAEICKDDLTAPDVSNATPDKNSRLNDTDVGVQFKVSDSVGGVDIGILRVVVSGTETVQPGGYVIVSSGIDNTGGYVDITGDITEYTITYSPALDWEQGEYVYVTVQCQDMVPQTIEAIDWACYDPDTRNFLDETYFIGIAAISDFPVSITIIPDIFPPRLDNVSPQQYVREADAYTAVEFDIVDDITGVSLDTIQISVDGEDIVIDGVVQTSEASLALIENGYRFYYKPTPGFDYGDSVFITVDAYDSYNLSPNRLYTSYFFTVISSGTTHIENFSPEENSSHLAETKYICADIYDTGYGIKDTYFVINNTVYSGSRTPIYGEINLSTVSSGITTISGATISGAVLYNVDAVFTSISGVVFNGGSISSGSISLGEIHLLPTPFDFMTVNTLTSGTISNGTAVSGTILDTLVSGVNWDGKFENSSVYGITISDSYFTNTTTSGTTVSGIIGYSICAHPDNNFNFGEVINIYVHSENSNSASPIIVDELYQLYYGYRVLKHKPDLEHNQEVSVFARAVNTDLIQQGLSANYKFTTYAQPTSNMPATLVAKVPWSDILAQIEINAPTQSYGETIEIELYIEDNEGNALGPYIFSYTVEES